MGLFNRPARATQRFDCLYCAWYVYDDRRAALDHMRLVHPARRALTVAPPAGPVQSEWVRRARAGLLPPKECA